MLALRLDCSSAAFNTPRKVLSILKLVQLKVLDFSGRSKNVTSAADSQAQMGVLLKSYKLGQDFCEKIGRVMLLKNKIDTNRSVLIGCFTKETTLERADFTLQLLMFVTAEKERQLFIIFILYSVFVSCCPRNFGQ